MYKQFDDCFIDKSLNKALSVALHAHKNQVDKGGELYLFHVLRVARSMKTIEEKIVALLHDVYEDTNLTIEDHCKNNFNESIVKAVDCLTRRENESVKKYYNRIKSNTISINVKIQDLTDNMNLSRLKEVTKKDIQRVKFYKRMRSDLVKYKNNISVEN